MVIINSAIYNSYFDVCKAYNIDYQEFIDYKRINPDICELDLLGHFIPNIAVRLDNESYIIRDKH